MRVGLVFCGSCRQGIVCLGVRRLLKKERVQVQKKILDRWGEKMVVHGRKEREKRFKSNGPFPGKQQKMDKNRRCKTGTGKKGGKKSLDSLVKEGEGWGVGVRGGKE